MVKYGGADGTTAPVFERRFGRSVVRIIRGDLVDQNAEAIVNAAHPGLSGGGGVDGAIHAAAGPAILDECRAYVRDHGPLPVGEAMWTHGGRLRARYVIHTVGPIYRTESESAPLLSRAYRRCLMTALELGVRSIAFPSISTGAYGYPVREAAPIAVSTVASFLQAHDLEWDVRWVCLRTVPWRAFRNALAAVVICLKG